MKIAKPIVVLVVGAIAFSLPAKMSAQTTYPLNTRAIYMTGCLLDNPPDFANTGAVIQKNKLCLCFLDKLQAEYSHDQFIQLFSDIDAGKPEARAEGEQFARRHIASCI
jgi:hypothetical protein